MKEKRFADYLGVIASEDQPSRWQYPGLRRQPWYSPSEISGIRYLEDSFVDIKREAVSLLSADGFHVEGEEIGRQGQWKVFTFYEMGRMISTNCGCCPLTASVLQHILPFHSSGMGSIYFSVLAPNSHILQHRGPTYPRLRCHLPLCIPEACGINVGGEIRTWAEGKCLLFDDSFVHEAWNKSSTERMVLVVDLWHPDLSANEVQLLYSLNRYTLVHAKHLATHWIANAKARAA